MKQALLVVVMLLALVACTEAITRRRETSFAELSSKTRASQCEIKDETGKIQQWNCVFDSPVCCSFQAKACCPAGYYCDESQTPVRCRKGQAAGGVTVNGNGVQTIHVFPRITINANPESSTNTPTSEMSAEASTATPGASSVTPTPQPSQAVSSEESSASTPMGMETSAPVRVPPFRQNIIIVKNINVLTKAQQPAPPPPKESSEESSERSEESSRSQESSERSERSERSEESSRS